MKYTGRVSTPKERKKTPNDLVMTNPETAKWIVDYFKPEGLTLDPCMGDGAFYDAFDCDKDWCEITKGKDFLNYNRKVDWIITNPPFSIFDTFLLKSFEVAANVVFFCPLTKVFKGKKLDMRICEYGGIKEVIHMGGGSKHGFPFGFSTGCIHYKRGHKGDMKITRNYS
jgi:hypothetical protein